MDKVIGESSNINLIIEDMNAITIVTGIILLLGLWLWLSVRFGEKYFPEVFPLFYILGIPLTVIFIISLFF